MGCGESKSPHVDSPEKRQAVTGLLRSPCRDGTECKERHLSEHLAKYSHPGDPDYTARPSCRSGEDCTQKLDQEHCKVYSHPGDEDYAGSKKVCKYGAECVDKDPRHRRRFNHAGDQMHGGGSSGSSQGRRRACKFGCRCFRRSPEHITEYAHPGDEDYRRGKVIFEDHVEPEFQTLRQLFDYCDPNVHGNFDSKGELAEALALLAKYREAGGPLDVDRAWRDLEGECNAFVGFAKFAAWSKRVGSSLPIGVEVTHADNRLSCGFVFPDGRRCDCKSFSANAGSPQAGVNEEKVIERKGSSLVLQFCTCGHKRSMHAERYEGSALASMAPVPGYWLGAGEDGSTQAALGPQAVARFQMLLDKTHKVKDNWTRDRGCNVHGLSCHASDPMCAFRNKSQVPSGYRVVGVTRNMNRELWGYFALTRAAVTKECETVVEHPFKALGDDVETSGFALEDMPMLDSCNEWFLFHGTSPERCRKICQGNFRLALAGTGATWKDAEAPKGTPLYGHGIYFADRITKADEYSDMCPAEHPFAGCFTVLVCRVLGGRAQYCDTNEIDPVALQKQVISGPFHSVFGDRVTKLKKPYREVVVYDATQCYPEYIVYYRRLFSSSP